VVAALWLIYIVIEWANVFLVLANTRVFYDDTQLVVRHVQQSLLLEDIQQVNLSADSYVAHFLGYLALWRDQFMHWAGLRNEPPPEKATVAYGKIVIGSLSFQRLLFERAANPHAMVQRINAELGKLRKQQEPELLRRIIEDQVYGRKPATTPKPMIFVETQQGPIPWLFKPNPEINPKTEEIVWRPFWIFLAFAMLPAVVALILATILLILAVRVGFIGAGPSFSIWLLVALVCLARIIWVREEHENDKYILTRDRIIDVDKKPFGPESSRVAQLGNIQNVSSDVSFVESIFGYGDVMITTGGGGGAFTFKHVPDPRNVQATITDYLTDFKKREKARAQQATLDLIKQYHEGQLRHEELLSEKQIQTVADKVNERLAVDVPSQVEREITTQLTDVVRRELARSGLRRRRRP